MAPRLNAPVEPTWGEVPDTGEEVALTFGSVSVTDEAMGYANARSRRGSRFKWLLTQAESRSHDLVRPRDQVLNRSMDAACSRDWIPMQSDQLAWRRNQVEWLSRQPD